MVPDCERRRLVRGFLMHRTPVAVIEPEALVVNLSVDLRQLEAGQDLAQQSLECLELLGLKPFQELLLAGGIRTDRRVDKLQPLVAQLHDDAAPIVRVGQP